MGLAGIPGAVSPQPVHGRDQVKQVRTRQVGRAIQYLRPGWDNHTGARRREPDRCPILSPRLTRRVSQRERLVHDAVADPGRLQRGQLRVAGRREHNVRRPQRLPGLPAEQPGRHPRAGREDDQQAGATPDGNAVGAGPADRVTVGEDATIEYWL